jgi:hypothetical protein
MRFARVFLATVFLGLCLTASCGVSPYEHQGDEAYARAQKLGGEEKQFAEKQAYQLYLLAVRYHPDKISPRLRARFIEMSVARAQMILSTSDIFSDPLQFFIEDIDTFFTGDIPSDIKQQYSLLLVQMADSFAIKNRYLDALRYIDKAVGYASDRPAIIRFRDSTVAKALSENLDRAQHEFAQGTAENSDAALIRALYYAEVAMFFDSTSADARSLLGKCRKRTMAICCDYHKALDAITDTLLFRKIDKCPVFLAVASLRQGGGAALEVLLSNYSNRAIALTNGDFSLLDTAGRRYKALGAEKKIGIVDQYKDIQFPLRFPKPAGKIAGIVFEKGDLISEKYFF